MRGWRLSCLLHPAANQDYKSQQSAITYLHQTLYNNGGVCSSICFSFAFIP